MARRRPSSRSMLGAVIVLTLLMLLSTGADSTTNGGHPLRAVVIAVSVIAAAIGAWLLLRREEARYAARLRRQELERALADERLAIARDLHDIVSHGLGLITMRVAVAREVNADNPAALAAALADVEAASRATTLEMRRMVHVLRGDEAPLAPLPSIERVSELVFGARQAGLRVTLSGEDVQAHSEGVSVAVYRIVQEALGNVARHVGPASVDVQLRQEDGTITVVVHDDGGHRQGTAWQGREPGRGLGREPGRQPGRELAGERDAEPHEAGAASRRAPLLEGPTSDGHGLRGLAERVEALGGELRAMQEQGGFTVWARIPDPLGIEMP